MALIRGTNLRNNLNGTNENDMLMGLGGNDSLNGGAGTDTAWYSGAMPGYIFSSVGGHLMVRDTNPTDGADGIDNLSGIELLQFGNGKLSLSSGEFRVNSTTANSQNLPTITTLADGGFVVSWRSNDQDGSGQNVYAQRYDAYGQAAGAEFRVNSTVADNQDGTNTTALADGGFVVTWTSYGQDPGGSVGIYAQRYEANGKAFGAEFRVNTTTDNGQYGSDIAALTDGGFVVTWTSYGQDGSSAGIFAQRYDANGNAVGVEFMVNTATTSAQQYSTIATLADGGFLVSWTSYGQDPDSSPGIYAKRYNSSGSPVGVEFRVNTHTSGDQIGSTIAALADGGFVVGWTAYDQDPAGDAGVYAQRFDAGGNTAGGEFRVNTTTASTQTYLTIAALADGGYVMGWMSDGQDGSNGGIYAQRYDAVGNTVGGEFRVNTTTLDNQIEPTIASMADGGFMVSWSSNVQDGSQFGIYAQRYDAHGDPVGMTLTGTAGADVINLDAGQLLTVDGGAGNDSITGSSGDDVLLGGLGADSLIGAAGSDLLDGGAGADRLSGGAGDDVYRVDNVADVLTEATGGGDDMVESSVSWILAANFEHLSLTGSNNINGTGNAQGNVIVGNSGNNVLDGKAGADVMSGGAGNDTYVVDNQGDYVDEQAASGTDLVSSSVSFTLGDHLENLTLTGNTAIDGNGNSGGNALLGNGADNALDGAGGDDVINGQGGNDNLSGGAGNDILTGGLGNDVLTGGADSDVFVFSAAPSAANVDTITDFSHADDVIYLSKSVFGGLTGIPNFTLPTEQFRSGAGVTTAGDADDHIIYNTTTGDLYYDKDGAGGISAVKLALLIGHPPTVDATDFFVTA